VRIVFGMAEEIAERLSSLQSEIQSYTAQILKHLSILYSPLADESIDLKNDPRNVLKVFPSSNNKILHHLLIP
jgi:hypothetical protein